jgi:hypothetical protein
MQSAVYDAAGQRRSPVTLPGFQALLTFPWVE